MEHKIQTEIIGYLRSLGYYVMRLNSGRFHIGEGRNRRYVMGHPAGTPDLMAFKKIGVNKQIYGLYEIIDMLFVEVKIPGASPSVLQEAKMEELTSYGARCIVAHSVTELQELLGAVA